MRAGRKRRRSKERRVKKKMAGETFGVLQVKEEEVAVVVQIFGTYIVSWLT